jgi:hypothetical protein
LNEPFWGSFLRWGIFWFFASEIRRFYKREFFGFFENFLTWKFFTSEFLGINIL